MSRMGGTVQFLPCVACGEAYGTNSDEQWPDCAGLEEMAPPFGMHWLAGSAAFDST